VRQAGMTPHCSRAEAVLLVRRAHQGDTAAKSDLIASNRRLVVSVARRYVSTPPKEDGWETRITNQPPDPEHLAPLLALGEQGLLTAVERFDESKGFAFPTYATWWIRQAITKGIQGGEPGGVREPRALAPDSSTGAMRLDLPS
jgi:DNA-directed RNA polymerase specialized sigma subunit